MRALLRFGQLPSPMPLDSVPILLVKCAEPRPKIAAHKQEQERNREEVIGLDCKIDHEDEIAADRQLDVGEQAAAAPVRGRPSRSFPDTDRIFRGTRKARLNAK